MIEMRGELGWVGVACAAMIAVGCSGLRASSSDERVATASAALGPATKIKSFPDGAFADSATIGGYDGDRWANIGSKTIFAASDSVNYGQIWVTDGTAQGTGLVGTGGVTFAGDPGLVSTGSLVFFPGGRGLWRTDGTPQGTFAVSDFPVSALTVLGSTAYAIAGSLGKVYASDGTAQGTKELLDTQALALASANGLLFISSQCSGVSGGCLYKSDGTAAGTSQIAGAPAGSSLAATSASVFYTAGTGNLDLWTSDGTSAVKITTLPRSVTGMTGFGSSVLLWLKGANGGSELWRATSTGASLVMAFPMLLPQSKGISVAGTEAYFIALDSTHGIEVWKTDGTPGGTSIVVDLDPGPASGAMPMALGPTPYMNGVVFLGDSGTGGQQLYFTDGTAAGTVPLGMATDPTGGPNPHANGSTLFFGGDTDLWKSTGPGAVSPVATVSPKTPRAPGNLLNVGSKIYFFGDYGTERGQLWATDGASLGTAVVSPPGLFSADLYLPRGIVALGNKVYFASGTNLGDHLYVSDGTPAGTQIASSKVPYELAASGSHVFFLASDDHLYAYDPVHGAVDMGTSASGITAFKGGVLFGTFTGAEWYSDGTTTGTFQVGAVGSTQDTEAAVLGNAAYYLAKGGLYRTDGTGGSATVVQPMGALGEGPVATSTRVFFSGADPAGGKLGIWQSDGTANGTTLVFPEVNPTPSYQGSWLPLYPVGDKVLFTYDDGSGNAWFLTDGVSTTKLTTALPGGCTPYAIGNQFFFCAVDQAGEELWISDGTVAGTARWNDLSPGPASSRPRYFTELGGKLLFIAYEGAIPSLYSADPAISPTSSSSTASTGGASSTGSSGSAGGSGTTGITSAKASGTTAGAGTTSTGTGGGGASNAASGCGCRVAETEDVAIPDAMLAAALAAAWHRRRRRRR